eukprot:3410185-Rhodomonas_salina.1
MEHAQRRNGRMLLELAARGRIKGVGGNALLSGVRPLGGDDNHFWRQVVGSPAHRCPVPSTVE